MPEEIPIDAGPPASILPASIQPVSALPASVPPESVPPASILPASELSVASASSAPASVCAQCGFETYPGEMFCENCSAPLSGVEQSAPEVVAAPAATQPIEQSLFLPNCGNCDGTEFEDGYCSNCGAPAVKQRDHWQEHPAVWVAGVTDRGLRHHRNEDGMALGAEPTPAGRAVLVVCDGVSSSMDPDIASLAAARAARDTLITAGKGGSSVAGRISAWTERLVAAGAAANAEVIATSKHPTNRPGERQDSPPSCTFVAAVVDGPLIVIGWVGDSRAYWVPDQGPTEILSVDDSWAAEAIAAGMARELAETARQAHAITRWMGVDSPDAVPRCVSLTPAGPGWLVVCSDGLWNYCSSAPELAAVVTNAAASHRSEPLATAAALVEWANSQGGRDNITVTLARVDPHPGA